MDALVAAVDALPVEVLCGQLIVGGFAGTSLSQSFAAALGGGRRAGAVLFKRNLPTDLAAIALLNASILAAAPPELPPLIAVDQEGGRVARLGAPLLSLPPMAQIGALGDVAFVERLAERQGAELAALGFTMNFAPVLDVHTRKENPVIGDRAFSSDPERVAELGVAWARGLEKGGVLACGKHFPGHGDTTSDSHFDLPRVEHGRPRLDSVELLPFRAAARAGIAALMTAHVVYPALDPGVPATLSPKVATTLRDALGFRGVLISDDLEMKAIKLPVEEAATLAVSAGCDLLLVCESEPLQDRAHAGLVALATSSDDFRARCHQAVVRGLRMRKRVRPRLASAAEMDRVIKASAAAAHELAARAGHA